MLDVAGVDAELLTSGNYVTINVFDAKNHTPIATMGDSARGARRRRCGTGDCYAVAAGPEAAGRRCKESPIAAGETIAISIKTAKGNPDRRNSRSRQREQPDQCQSNGIPGTADDAGTKPLRPSLVVATAATRGHFRHCLSFFCSQPMHCANFERKRGRKIVGLGATTCQRFNDDVRDNPFLHK